jgi:hypothetical protein
MGGLELTAVHAGDELAQPRLRDAVDATAAGAVDGDQALAAKHAKLLRDDGLVDIEGVGEAADVHRAFAEQGDDADADGMSQRLEDLGNLPSALAIVRDGARRLAG